MKKTVRICDLCDELGEEKLAVATYEDKTGYVNDVCKDCLTVVIKSGLKYRMLENE